MSNIKMIKNLGFILAIMLIIWGIYQVITAKLITNEIIVTAIILIMLGVAYSLILYNKSWTKAIFFFEGLIIGVSGHLFLDNLYGISFLIIGFIIVIIAILAYIQKLPASILKWFY